MTRTSSSDLFLGSVSAVHFALGRNYRACGVATTSPTRPRPTEHRRRRASAACGPRIDPESSASSASTCGFTCAPRRASPPERAHAATRSLSAKSRSPHERAVATQRRALAHGGSGRRSRGRPSRAVRRRPILRLTCDVLAIAIPIPVPRDERAVSARGRSALTPFEIVGIDPVPSSDTVNRSARRLLPNRDSQVRGAAVRIAFATSSRRDAHHARRGEARRSRRPTHRASPRSARPE